VFLFRMLSVKKVKDRSDAFGPSSPITAGMVAVAARSIVAESEAPSVVRFRLSIISIFGSSLSASPMIGLSRTLDDDGPFPTRLGRESPANGRASSPAGWSGSSRVRESRSLARFLQSYSV
jgi:hypothetical protein